MKNKNNPLQKEYEKEYRSIFESARNHDWLINVVLFFVFTILYVMGFINFIPLFRYLIIVLGVINSILCFIFIKKGDRNTGKVQTEKFNKKIKKLNDKYAKWGYTHDDIDFLCKCEEYDGCRGQFVCSVDFTPLSYEQQRWCQTEGNCLDCDILDRTLFLD